MTEPVNFALESLPDAGWSRSRVAKELGCKPWHVDAWVEDGALPPPAFRIKGRPYWSPAAVRSSDLCWFLGQISPTQTGRRP